MAFENKGALTATVVVAASGSLNKAAANFVCTGTNDHLTIQEALDALPATGGEVFLLDGTYNIEASLVLDSYQTLRGCGRSTILTTTTADVDIITATGGAGTEKVGILIADLCVDGNAGGAVNDIGILWAYVDYSKIRGVWSQNNGEDGIKLSYCDFNQVLGNISISNSFSGIYLDTSSNNVVDANTVKANWDGIYLSASDQNTVYNNICEGGNGYGVDIESSDNNTVVGNRCWNNGNSGIFIDRSHNNIASGNECVGNNDYGVFLSDSNFNSIHGNLVQLNENDGIEIADSHHNNIVGNVVNENSQVGDNTDENILVEGGDYNLIASNVCRRGVGAKQSRYGISIDASSNKNIVQGNDLHDAGKTANFNDAGTCTIVEDDNREIGVNQVKRYVYMKNTSAAQRVAGDVVVFKSGVAAGDEFTTTVTLGDDHVEGMVAETIAVDAYGYVQVAGKTTVLKGSNDNGAITVGDFLCASDTAVEAVKAGALDTAFAIALEALDAAGPTALDALLINPMTF